MFILDGCLRTTQDLNSSSFGSPGDRSKRPCQVRKVHLSCDTYAPRGDTGARRDSEPCAGDEPENPLKNELRGSRVVRYHTSYPLRTVNSSKYKQPPSGKLGRVKAKPVTRKYYFQPGL